MCGGNTIPNYNPSTGYTGSGPFVTMFSDCEAKDDTGSTRDYAKLPLIRIRDMIDSVDLVKDRPAEQIFVSGIIGWPRDGKLDGVEYRIDKDSTSMPVEEQKKWDYMPICTVSDPAEASTSGNLYKAYGAFRLKKFLDAFQRGTATNTYSICEPDFSEPLAQIGKSLAKPWQQN